jgi:hypothetical protein
LKTKDWRILLKENSLKAREKIKKAQEYKNQRNQQTTVNHNDNNHNQNKNNNDNENKKENKYEK